MKNLKKSFWVLSAALMAMLAAGLNANPSAAHAETAEESGYTWKAVDKFTAGRKYIIGSSSKSKVLNDYGTSATSCVIENNELVSISSNKYFEKCAFTAEQVGTSSFFNLRSASDKYLIAAFEDSDYFLDLTTYVKVGFKYNSDGSLETNSYAPVKGTDSNYDYTYNPPVSGTTYLSFGYNPSISTSKSNDILIFEQQAATTDKYYDVTLSGGEGATGETVTASVKEGDLYTLPENTFTKAGFKFVCWTDGEKDYNPGDEVTVNGELSLTAKWEALSTYTIRFFDLDDNDLGKEFTVTEGQNKYFYVTYAKEGYNFLGWSTAKDDTVEYENTKYYVFTSDLNLYPVLKPVMDTVMPTASIRTGESAGLRFKYTITKDQINNTFGYNYDLSSYEYGLAVVKTSSLLEVNSYGYLRSTLMNNNVTDQSVNNEKWSLSLRDDWTGKYSTLNVRNIKATNKEFKDGAVTFAGVIAGFNDLPETTAQELEAKKELYNAEFTVVAYVALNDHTFKYAAQAKYSYMNAVNEYLTNASVYNLSSSQIEELTAIKENYGL